MNIEPPTSNTQAPTRAARGRAARLGLLRLAGCLLPRPPTPTELTATARLLIIRPDHLGDVLLTAPAVGLLRRALPGARLTYLVGPWSAEAARRGPAVDEVLTCPFPGFTRRPKPSALQPYLLVARQASRLRGRYDAALVLRPDHWWGALLAVLAGIPVRLGFNVPECIPLLTHVLPAALLDVQGSRFEVRGSALEAGPASELHPTPPPGTANLPPGTSSIEPRTSNLEPQNLSPQLAAVALVQRLLSLTTEARPGLQARAEPFRVDAAEAAWAAAWLAEHGLAGASLLVAIHPGAGAALKLWPAERWVRVGAHLAERYQARLLVTGGTDERPLAEQIAHGIGPAAVCAAGQTSLGHLAALLARADLALGPDSGPLHLAAAVGVPTTRLFGPTDPAIFMPPDLPRQQAVTADLPCRPCRTLERPPCGATAAPACLLGIAAEDVVPAAARLLGQATAGRPPESAGD